MKLIWVKSNGENLVGEVLDAFGGSGDSLLNPMRLEFVNMPAPSSVIANGKKPQMVTGFKFTVIPSIQIFVSRVDWHGEIKKHDGAFITYYKVLEAQKKQEEDPLMVAQ